MTTLRVLFALAVAVAVTGCSTTSRPTAATTRLGRHHDPSPASCIEFRYNFRPLIRDVQAAAHASRDGRIDPHYALRRLNYTISGLRTALRDAKNELIRRRLETTLADAERLRPRLPQQQLQLRLGVLSEAYSAARTACRAATG